WPVRLIQAAPNEPLHGYSRHSAGPEERQFHARLAWSATLAIPPAVRAHLDQRTPQTKRPRERDARHSTTPGSGVAKSLEPIQAIRLRLRILNCPEPRVRPCPGSHTAERSMPGLPHRPWSAHRG